MQMRIDGKVAIVTGAGDPGGMGASFARALAEAGAAVVIADINESGARAVAARLTDDGLNALAVGVDVTDEASVAATVAATVDAFGGVDILINNAALVAQLKQGVDLVDYPLDEWHRVFAVNLTGSLLCVRAAVPLMRARGGGRIVNISSGGAFQLKTPYSISKLGVVGMTVILSEQLAKDNINVNSIAPGMVETTAGLQLLPPGSAARERFTATLRPGAPSDLHGALLLLTSSAGDWITGQTLNVDGGWIKRV